MIPTQNILQVLQRGVRQQVALLVDDNGNILGGNRASPDTLDWFQKQFATGGAAAFFAKAASRFTAPQQTAVWSTAPIRTTRKWWLVYLYNPTEEFHSTRFSSLYGHLLMATCLILAGGSLAVLVWTLGRRLEEHRRHLQERKQLEWQVQEVSERVQRRISENLREDLCQRLTGIAALSAALGRKLELSKVPEARLASEVTQEIQESLTRALSMADELQDVSLQQDGFLAAVQTLAMQAAQRSSLSCRVEAEEFEAELGIAISTQLFRIVQEAVDNAVRHARATEVVIRLVSNPQQVIASVSDNGIGEAQQLNREPGLGLRIMRYRSDLIGAQLEILSAGTRGILVRCSCTLTKDAGPDRDGGTVSTQRPATSPAGRG